MVNPQNVVETFQKHFGTEPEVLVRAPGRVNIIGEHTDYNDGFVLPIAVEQATWVAVAARPDRTVRAHAVSDGQSTDVHLDNLPRPEPAQHWPNYLVGILAGLRKAGCQLLGADLLIDGDIPIGGGLSSSAALEVGLAKAMLAGSVEFMETVEVAMLCRQAEHRYAGVPCGIMDQFACMLGQAGSALLLDCRSQQYEHVPVDHPGQCFVIIDTQVKHELGTGEYAKRQEQCQAGVDYFRRIDPDVQALRDVGQPTLMRHISQMDPTVAARCHHVVTENARVLDAVDAFKRDDPQRVGRLLVESHQSLHDRYEVSCDELDAVVEVAIGVDGVYGARMTGGGFGGCVVALARDDAVDALRQAIADMYDTRHPKPARILLTKAAAGAEVVPL